MLFFKPLVSGFKSVMTTIATFPIFHGANKKKPCDSKESMNRLNCLFSGKKSYERAIKQGGEWKAMKQETLALGTSSIIHAIKMKWLTMLVSHFRFLLWHCSCSAPCGDMLLWSFHDSLELNTEGEYLGTFISMTTAVGYLNMRTMFALRGYKNPHKHTGKH